MSFPCCAGEGKDAAFGDSQWRSVIKQTGFDSFCHCAILVFFFSFFLFPLNIPSVFSLWLKDQRAREPALLIVNELLVLLACASITWCLCSGRGRKKKTKTNHFWKILVTQDNPTCFTGSCSRAVRDIFSSLCAQDCFAFGVWDSCAGASSSGQNVCEDFLLPLPLPLPLL